jgi:DNA-binding CsgD family transcriptional regulator
MTKPMGTSLDGSSDIDSPLPPDELRQMLSLVGTLAELPPDPAVRRRYVLAELCKLVGGAFGLAMCCHYEGPDHHLRVCSASMVGLGDLPERIFNKYLQTGLPPDPMRATIMAQTQPLVTWRRCEAIDDDVYRASVHFRELRVPLGIDDCIYSARRHADGPGSFCLFELCRSTNDPPFAERERRIVHAIRQQECRLPNACGVACRAALTRSLGAGLSPRMQKLLPLLLAGQSERQIAQQVGLSVHTVHGYVKTIYTRLGVGSRNELLAKWLQHRPRP